MTIKLISVPRMSESWIQVISNVKAVTKFDVIFHDGSKQPKRIGTKVELLSLMDKPEDGTEEYEAFCERHYHKNWCGIYHNSWYEKMSMADFDALDLMNYI